MESLDDLRHLKYVVEPGDLIHALTYRRVEELFTYSASRRKGKYQELGSKLIVVDTQSVGPSGGFEEG
ncbi:MAG: hypothetical protein SYNGOMJ08_00655 [Candidatus Syntrophoarchaeum sp. GoM_oil]|nr:MAG: hypothetical protein SYNGOMJ08_00655 [Candidatus Syntrophoarchaeum sp. GoM_oil]